jgi:Rad3-related DNA helicase
MKENKMAEATMALFDKNVVTVGARELRDVANQYTVCPYELSLCYSELCDVIICDFNYLFDPQVYIRRFFSQGGEYAFLIDEAHNLGERAREMYSADISLSELSDLELLGEYSKLKKTASEISCATEFILRELLRSELRTNEDGEEYGAYHSRELPTELYDLFDLLVSTAEDELVESYRAKDEEAEARSHYIREYLFRIKKFRSAMMRFDEKFEFFIMLDGQGLRMKVFCLDTGGVIKQRLALGRAAVIFSGTLSPLSYYKSVLGGDGASVSLELDSPFVSEQLSVSVMHNVTTRTSEREKSLPAVCRVIAATLSAKRGNYMIFAPSYAYAKALYTLFSKKYPKIRSILQTPDMTAEEKAAFLDEFSSEGKTYLAAFCVTGGVYSEGIDLAGNKLIGAVIVGIGMPALSFEREAISAYYEEKLEMGVQYAYLYPGMNKVLQAAGRVIRTENDRGVIVLIDDRFDDPIYKKTMPTLWKGMQFLEDASELRERLDEFWQGVDEESEN